MGLSQWGKRPVWQWTIVLIIVAFLLRIPNLGRDSLWFDEAISYLAATLPTSQIINNTVQSSHPPLYYLLLHFWQLIVPDSDMALRFLGVLWNILLIPLIAQLAFDLFKQKSVAIVAALLVALSPFHILYSHELRMYTQLMFLVCLGTWGYWRARSTGRWKWWAVFAIGFAAAVFTHLFATLALAAVGIHAWLYREDKQAFGKTAVIIALIIILFAPWLVLIAGESQQDLGSLRPLTTASSRNVVKPLISLTFLLFGQSSQLIFSGFALFLTLAFTAILLLEIRRIRKEGVTSSWMLLILLIIFVWGVPLVIYLIRPFFLPERTMAAASPFLILLLAWTFTRNKTPFPYLVTISGIVMFIGALLYHIGPSIKPPYKEVMDYVSENAKSGDIVLHTSDGSYLPGLRYASIPNHAVLAGDPDPRKSIPVYEAMNGNVWTFAQAQNAGEHIWLIVAYEHSLEWQQKQVETITNSMTINDEQNIGGILIYQFEK